MGLGFLERRSSGLRGHGSTGNPALKQRSVDQLNIAPLGEGLGLIGIGARGHDKATRGALSRHYAEELSDHSDADLDGLPLFALDQVLVGPHVQDEIDATIRTAAATLDNGETLAPECFAHQLLKLAPVDAIDGFSGLSGGSYIFNKPLALGSADD
ncbi:hypothetical protein D3C78_1347230 [compost metagenome]